MTFDRKRATAALIVSLGLVLALAAAGCAQNVAPAGSRRAQGEVVSATIGGAGDKAPNFAWTTPDQGQMALADVLGTKPIVLEFFATWCPSCMASVPEMQRFHEQHAGADLAFYAISVQESKDTVERWMNTAAIGYPVLVDPEAWAARAYDAKVIPLIVGIDRSGKIVYREHAMPADVDAFLASLGRGGTTNRGIPNAGISNAEGNSQAANSQEPGGNSQ